MALHDLIVPVGVFTYAVLWLSLLSGKRIIKVGFKWHRAFGMTALIAASFHAGLVLYYEMM